MDDVQNKKEVTCKVLTALFSAAERKGADISKLMAEIPYDLSYLYNKNERIEWDVYGKIISKLRNFLSENEFEYIGTLEATSVSYPAGLVAGFIFFSSNKFARILIDRFFKVGNNMFSCIRYETQFRAKNNILISLYLDEGYEFCPEFFLTTKGYFKALGDISGHKNFQVNLKWIKNGAIYNVSWQKKVVFLRISKWLKWLFNIRKALLDLTDSHEELLNQYNKLEESKKILLKQTTQLKTAHEITKSIRQSRDLKNTLNAITQALINDANFSSAKIKLFRDIEGNELEINSLSGTGENSIVPISQPIIINNENIGELIVHPKIGKEQYECEEQLTYLQPIINITIHDALVLRTVTDYKNNLEAKVETRTEELKKAQSKLSETIHLLEEAQRAQNHFFTNISHEFRTPLTLILGPSKQILEKTTDEKIKEQANIIHRSAKKLNRLANQLLDISRIESGKMKLNTSEQNLVEILKEIVSSFQSFAERKNISLKLKSQKEEFFLYLDKDKIDKIMSNLLSNALKFTPKDGCVEVGVNLLSPPSEGLGVGQNRLKSNYVEISIADTGIGIPKEQLDKIFDRFYQVDNRLSKEYEGTGVGLSLTKELIELHKGKISVESEEGNGSIFRVFLPVGKKHLLPEEIIVQSAPFGEDVSIAEAALENEFISQADDSSVVVESHNHELTLASIDKLDKPTLLIVEDNPGVRNYINDILKQHYKIFEACNGEDGLTKSLEQIPDLIISDIMMPKMDGFQLCSNLKSDYRTSHIPVILLTAKTTIKDKVEGFESGADSYIMKPFEAEELKSRIKNLIEQRKRLHKHFQKHGLIELDEKKVTSIDQKFLQKAVELTNEHIADSCFSIDKFAEGMSVSRSLLHKKLSALIGEPPGELIKRIRLNKAAELIEHNSGNITEISFEVGFNNSSYFTECFKKQFGVSPSQFNKSH